MEMPPTHTHINGNFTQTIPGLANEMKCGNNRSISGKQELIISKHTFFAIFQSKTKLSLQCHADVNSVPTNIFKILNSDCFFLQNIIFVYLKK